MTREIDLGKVWLPEELIKMVEKHKHNVLSANRGTEQYHLMLKADFSLWFGDFLFKNFYKLQEN